MLIVGAVAGLTTCFCSMCVCATIALPERLQEGDTVSEQVCLLVLPLMAWRPQLHDGLAIAEHQRGSSTHH